MKTCSEPSIKSETPDPASLSTLPDRCRTRRLPTAPRRSEAARERKGGKNSVEGFKAIRSPSAVPGSLQGATSMASKHGHAAVPPNSLQIASSCELRQRQPQCLRPLP